MLWEVDIYPAEGQPDRVGARLAAEAAELNLAEDLGVTAGQGYLIEGALDEAAVRRVARTLLSDPIVQRAAVGPAGADELNAPPAGRPVVVHVLPKPGVMDPVAQSAQAAMADAGLEVCAVRTLRKYFLSPLPAEVFQRLCGRLLANEAIEQVVVGPLRMDRLALGSSYVFQRVEVPLRVLNDEALRRLSRDMHLSLSLTEMQTIQAHFRQLNREPTDAELETLAQTWSEHCSHKTLAGRIAYQDEHGSQQFENMLRETIFAATQQIRRELGQDDWCVSVFRDNAGVVRFDEQWNVCFKVETHNHPSALEPYGGANTGLGGVIRDPLGTGLGARPVCNTDVFCFAPPDTPLEALPPGVLHPKLVLKGVVAGVRDYGNRMGIPTVNGAVYFDPRYLANPLVYCGNVGLLPADKSFKQPRAGDLVVVAGGRTGRDGIHGATFSSIELTEQSETASSGAVQIGNAITEKMLLDVLLQARDRGLYHAITDCGAGGLSSAVGEMGEELGAEVHLERVPLKYQGLSYTEIWISEAQERMVLAVPPENWPALEELCAAEGVEATAIGSFTTTGRLQLYYEGEQVADLSMEFLHGGRPPVVRRAEYRPAVELAVSWPEKFSADYTPELKKILSSLNVASKEWIIRQYDHEVQGGSVIKPLVGAANDGPSDAAVIRPILSSRRGLVVACGMNPRYGDFDTYHMAAGAIDEAVRNCVAVGADPRRIAILDNFCWGNTDRPETLGSLVRAALACREVAVALGTPFISGKDSLNNEFSFTDADGQRQTITIPPSLLISALGQVDDVARCVTMDFKAPGNYLYQVGITRDELGGSHLTLVRNLAGGRVPRVDPAVARRIFHRLHAAIAAGLVRACHDLSEGGLAVAAAESAFAGNVGARIELGRVPYEYTLDSAARATLGELQQRSADGAPHPLSLVPHGTAMLLFSESHSRFLCEVRPQDARAFEAHLDGVPHAHIGWTTDTNRLEIAGLPRSAPTGPGESFDVTLPLVIHAELALLKDAWQAPLRW